MLARAGAILAAAVLLLIAALPAPSAFAHGRGSDATNYVSTVRSAPEAEGVSFRVFGSDEYLSVTNTSDVEVTVLGYDGEPYLRVGPEGVFENARSEAAYLNDDRFQRVEVPATVDNDAEPDWVRVGDGPTWLWHDHRAHWMSPLPSPPILADPGSEHVVNERWVIPVLIGDEPAEVTGDLRWVPGSSPWPWLAVGLLLTLPALAGLRTKPTSEDQWPGLARPAAVVLGLLAAVNLVNLVDDLFAVPLPLSIKLIAAAQTALFLLIAAFGAMRGWQAREGAFTALGVGSAALLVGQGLLYLGVLTTSQTASVFPTFVTRSVVALSVAQAIPLGIVAVLGTRRLLPPLEEEPEASAQAAPA
jgi:hypothetical protein